VLQQSPHPVHEKHNDWRSYNGFIPACPLADEMNQGGVLHVSGA